MQNLNNGNVVRFTYNGKLRIVAIEKVAETYIQGQNLNADAENKYSTYRFDRMESDVEILEMELQTA